MISVERLYVHYGGFTLRADLAVPKGQVCTVLGPSGAGKSTLLGALAGFVTPTSGRIAVMDRDISLLHPSSRPLTLLFQDNNLFPDLTAAQNVGLGLRPSLALSAAERREVDDALSRTDLAGLGERLPCQLSGGQRQRVALARALLRDRPVLLLDEPFAALGPALRADMLDLTLNIARERGATVMMVTHDPADARRAGGLLAFCKADVDGGVIENAVSTFEALARPSSALAAYLGDR